MAVLGSNAAASQLYLGLIQGIIEIKELGMKYEEVEGCQVRQSTLRGSTRETGLSYLHCTEVGT
jgi:hypothetical protein